jgi:cytochrome c556
MVGKIRLAASMAVIAVGLALTTFVDVLAQDDPEAVVEYRQALMGSMGGHATALASVVKGEVAYNDHVLVHAWAIHETSKFIPDIFPEGTGRGTLDDETTRALPEIWEDRADFEAAAEDLTEESAKLVEAARSGDAAAVAQQFASMGKNGCGNCHDTFRAEEEE